MTAPTTRETADHIGEANEKVTADRAELAACPFCGSAAKLSRIISPEGERRGDTPSWDIECDDCWLHGRWSSERDARTAWNRRAPQGPLLSEIAALRGERDAMVEGLKDATTVHINMLRGGIAKPPPCNIGHLYRGDDAVAVVAEVMRQNPEAFPATQAERQRDEEIAVHTRIAAEVIEARRQRDELRKAVRRAMTFVNLCVDAGELQPDDAENPADLWDALNTTLIANQGAE